jgi:hypothetical protein
VGEKGEVGEGKGGTVKWRGGSKVKITWEVKVKESKRERKPKLPERLEQDQEQAMV